MPGLSDHDMITKIYTELMGMDGKGGLIKEHSEMQEDIRHIYDMPKEFVTITNCKENQKAHVKEQRNNRLHIKDNVVIIGVTFSCVGVVFAVILGFLRLGVFK